jgi:hypothetical protein
MQILLLANTYFQLIAAIQLRMTEFASDTVDLILSDHSISAYDVYKRVDKNNLFNNVYYSKNKEHREKDPIYIRLRDAVFLEDTNLLFRTTYPNVERLIKTKYDIFLFYNIDLYTIKVFSNLRKNNPQIRHRYFQEGYVNNVNGMIKLIGMANRIASISFMLQYRRSFRNSAEGFYFFNTDMVNRAAIANDILEIPPYDTKKLKHILNMVFQMDEIENIPQPFIFLEQAFNEDGLIVQDTVLVEQIIKTIGIENFVVKLHPRSRQNRFVSLQIPTIKNSNIPFEAFCLKLDIGNKVFITINSGSALTPVILLNVKPRMVIYLHRLVDQNNLSGRAYVEEIIRVTNKRDILDVIKIPQTTQELEQILLELINEYKSNALSG